VPDDMHPDSESQIFSGIAIASGSAPRAVVVPMSVSASLLGIRAGRVYRQRCIQRTKHILLAHDPCNRNQVVKRQSGKIALDSVVEEGLAGSLLDRRRTSYRAIDNVVGKRGGRRDVMTAGLINDTKSWWGSSTKAWLSASATTAK